MSRVIEWDSERVTLSIDIKTKVVQHVESDWMREWKIESMWEWESVPGSQRLSDVHTFLHIYSWTQILDSHRWANNCLWSACWGSPGLKHANVSIIIIIMDLIEHIYTTETFSSGAGMPE